MDLIYTDTEHKDVGILNDYTLDLAFGSDENDFALTIALNKHCCMPNYLIYIENTEYGGIIDKIGVVTKDEKLTYTGRTWQGILSSKIIIPDAGTAYLTVSGEVHEVIGNLLVRIGLDGLFTVSQNVSNFIVKNYSFDRYINAYEGIQKMLESVNAKLDIRFVNGKVILSASAIIDYSASEEFDSDLVEMDIEQITNTVNHLICLGKGELENRLVVHLYLDEKGKVVKEQKYFGLGELCTTYDSPNTDSEEELEENGTEKLREYAVKNSLKMDFTADEDTYCVGDIIGARENTTGTLAVEKITKKIVTVTNGTINIQYKVGE